MMHRPFAVPAMSPHAAVPAAVEPEYPSIDEFLDDLPPIEDFLASDEEIAEEPQPVEEEDWLTAGWKSYDFTSLSALAMRTPSRPVRALPERVMKKTPDQNPSYSTSQPGPSADEIASALDGIARRIRSGELVIDHLHGIAPEAAMAAAIAALLRMRG